MSQGSEYVKHHPAPQGPALREGLPPLPSRMAHLRRDARGYPVPWFVAWIDGVPDFRVIRPGGTAMAFKRKLCWLCGHPMGVNLSFVIGPMCAVNQITAEPASHKDCAEFAVQACPFLTIPNAKRREANIPEDTKEPAGVMIRRNPGVSVIWTSSSYRPFSAPGGYLFQLGTPVRLRTPTLEDPLSGRWDVQWWREGRLATRQEAVDALRSGMPLLIEMAQAESAAALKRLSEQYQAALFLLPEGAAGPGLDPYTLGPDAPGAGPASCPVSG